MTKKKNGFTIIELIAVLVIMAILALIVTPLVMNIVRKARIAADKRSIDAYGRSIELAITGYLLDNGKFPTSVGELTIEYSGNKVECSTTQLKPDSSVYLTGCTVAGRTVDYTYGKIETITYKLYELGDEITYNGVNYYVMKSTDETEANVTLLKAEPLTVDEVNLYGGVGTENNHVNEYQYGTVGSYPCYHSSCSTAGYSYNENGFELNSSDGYGTMAYYAGPTCKKIGYDSDDDPIYITDGCTTGYESSEIKYVVDAWALANIPSGIQEARILKQEDFEYLGYIWTDIDTSGGKGWVKTDDTPDWVYNNNYRTWTMSAKEDSDSVVIVLTSNTGEFSYSNVYNDQYSDYYGIGVVRPIITISKSSL